MSTRGNEALPDWFDPLQLRELFSQFEDSITRAVILSSSSLQRVGKVTLTTIPAASLALQTVNSKYVSCESETCTISVRYWRESDNINRPTKMTAADGDCDREGYDWASRTLHVRIHNCKGPDVDISDSHLRSHFQEFGRDLRQASIKFDPTTGKPLGYAFVTFTRQKIALMAMENLQGSMLNGKHKLVLSPKKTSEELKQKAVPKPKQEGSHSILKRVVTLQLKDEVIQMLLLQNAEVISGFNTLAIKEGVELTPLPQPQVGFQVKGNTKACEAVKEYFDWHRTALEQKEVGYAQIILSAPYKGICSASELDYRKDLKENSIVVTKCSFERPAVGSACLQIGKSHVACIHVVVGSLNTEKVDVVVVPTDRATGNNGTQVLEEIGDVVSFDGGSFASSYIIQTLLPAFEQANHLSRDTAIKNSLSLASRMHLGSVAFPGIKTEMIKCLVDSLSSMGPTTLHTVHIVLNTRAEADSFEKTLSDLVSKSSEKAAEEEDAGPEEASPLASAVQLPALPSASNSGLWSWRDDDGLFKPYSQAGIDKLNNAFKTDPDNTCVLNINGTRYGVNFKTMKQVNLVTKHQRDIRKVLSQSVSWTWKYRDDYQRFMPYSPTDSAQIEAMYQAKSTSLHLVILNRTYKFDFVRMKQVNVKSGYERDIRREPSWDDGVVKSKISKSRVAGVKFLCKNEVVLNLKGPSKSIDEVKIQLEKKLKSLLFSKTVRCPSQATPALLFKLKEASRKHLVTCTVVSSRESGAKDESESIQLEGLELSVKEVRADILELINDFLRSLGQIPTDIPKYPADWDDMSRMEQVKIVDLKPDSSYYKHVSSKFRETLPNRYVLKVQRVQNEFLWDRYVQTKRRLHKKNAGTINEEELFHGTRDKPAKVICTSEEGFDMRFSRAGMWGQANYFAVNASYSDTYAYHDSGEQTNELILVKVLTGDSYSCGPDNSLRMPPLKKQSSSVEAGQIQQVRYDSVNGTTHGSQVYMTYANDLAYPAYIITYTKNPSVAAAYTHHQTASTASATGYGTSSAATGYTSSSTAPSASTTTPSASSTTPSASNTTTLSLARSIALERLAAAHIAARNRLSGLGNQQSPQTRRSSKDASICIIS